MYQTIFFHSSCSAEKFLAHPTTRLHSGSYNNFVNLILISQTTMFTCFSSGKHFPFSGLLHKSTKLNSISEFEIDSKRHTSH